MMFSIRSGSGSTSCSYIGASAVLPRMAGRASRIMPGARGLRGRGAAELGLFARPDSPSRCTLPITALRVMPPSSAAIWLADNPSVQSFFSVSTRSSVQVMPQFLASRRRGEVQTESHCGPGQRPVGPTHTRATDLRYDCPPHEVSYWTMEKLQYGGSQAQESDLPASTSSVRV